MDIFYHDFAPRNGRCRDGEQREGAARVHDSGILSRSRGPGLAQRGARRLERGANASRRGGALRILMSAPLFAAIALCVGGACALIWLSWGLITVAEAIAKPLRKPTPTNVVNLDHERHLRIAVGPLSPGNECRITDTDGAA
jgi:hypothetical protein